ncbi:MAG: adenylate/guanylate cyclase domain-containing protein [Acidimicrobiales bacterium]
MAGIPETHLAETAVGRIAYQIVGDGPVDVLVFHPPHFPIDLMWDEPRMVEFLDGLSTFCRHIWFDPRGRGASDPLDSDEVRLQETIVEDMVFLLDNLGLERVVILGLGAGVGPLFAATHPDRTTALVILSEFTSYLDADVTPDRTLVDARERALNAYGATYGTLEAARLTAPHLASDTRFCRWLARSQRLTFTAAEAVRRLRLVLTVSQGGVLDAVKVPTLVLSTPVSGLLPPGSGPELARRITGAKYVEVGGADTLYLAGQTGPMLDAIEEFLTGDRPTHDSNRVLATVMFTDIVGSTDRLARVGDRSWKATLTAHDTLVAREIERHRGRRISTTGDGVLATFDGPGRAVRCAQAITEAVQSLGIEVRAGVHTGEIELRGDDVGGIGVHIAARVSSLAGPSEVLVSRTVTDLVAGSGIEFDDRGERELKGVPGPWRVYAVVA